MEWTFLMAGPMGMMEVGGDGYCWGGWGGGVGLYTDEDGIPCLSNTPVQVKGIEYRPHLSNVRDTPELQGINQWYAVRFHFGSLSDILWTFCVYKFHWCRTEINRYKMGSDMEKCLCKSFQWQNSFLTEISEVSEVSCYLRHISLCSNHNHQYSCIALPLLVVLRHSLWHSSLTWRVTAQMCNGLKKSLTYRRTPGSLKFNVPFNYLHETVLRSAQTYNVLYTTSTSIFITFISSSNCEILAFQ